MKFRSTRYPRLRVHFDDGSVRFTDGELETDDAAAIKALEAIAKRDDSIEVDKPKRQKRQPKADEPKADEPKADEPKAEADDAAPSDAQVTVEQAIAEAAAE